MQKLWRVGLWLGLLAGVLHAIGYALYAYGVWNDDIHTNIVSWGLWVLGTVMAYFVYSEIAHDWVKSLLNLVCVIGMFCVFGLVAYKLWLDPSLVKFDAGMVADLSVAVLDIFVMFIWILFRKRSMNVVDGWFQVDIFLSFIPIMRSTLTDSTAETLLPWTLWTLAYLAQYFCVAFRPTHEDGVVNAEDTKRSLNTPLHYFAWHLGMTIVLVLGGAALV